MADKNVDFITSFENSLKLQNTRKFIPLYSEDKSCKSNIKVSAKEVILNVSQQMKAIKIADSVKKMGNKSELNMYKKNDFIPVNTLTTDEQPKQIQGNKFDTQCVSDTQLINVIECAEALMDVPKEMSQEFNAIFCDQNIDIEKHSELYISRTLDCSNFDKSNLKINSNCLNNNGVASIINKSIISQNGSCILEELPRAQAHADVNKVKSQSCSKDMELDIQLIGEKSPIQNRTHSPIFKSKSPSPLVFGLDTFERFETIAMPVIKENQDIETAKRLINSQIITNELNIQSHAEPVLCDRDKSVSPILKIKKKRTEKFNNNTITKVRNGVLTVEDNVLFNSDEEDDFAKNEELPLTCALETSFYNAQDLDKTMYVGFQTASNKSIQISSKTYNKARSMLDDSINNIPLMKLVEVIDNSYKNIEDQKSLNKKNDIESKKDNSLLNCISDEDNTQHILMNEDAVKHTYPTDTEQLNIDDNILKEFETNFVVESNNNNNKTEMVSKSDTENINKTCFSNLRAPNAYKETSDTCNMDVKCEGFKTANNKEIKLSKYGLMKLKNVFEDIDLTDIQLDIHNCKQNYDIRAPSTSKDYMAFESANNKPIEVPVLEKSVNHYLTKLNNLDTFNNKMVNVNTDQKKTVPDVKITYPDPSRNDSRYLLHNSSDNNEDEEINVCKEKLHLDIDKEVPTFIGFHTASNKPVKISKEALAKSKTLFQDIDTMLDCEIAKVNNNSARKSNLCNQYTGFQTASNKLIPISKEALVKSKKIFDSINKCDIDPTENNKKCKQSVEDFVGINQPSNNCTEILNVSKNDYQDKNHLDYKSNTASVLNPNSNEPVTISKENKENKNICLAEKQPYDNKVQFKGFKTASNKSVKISENALRKSKQIFQDMDINDSNYNNITENKRMTKPILQGFQTASSKPVHISEAALDKTKHIFKDIVESGNTKFNSNNTNNTPIGFKTASDKFVKISEEDLSKSRKVFQDIDVCKNFDSIEKNSKEISVFEGFKTASLKPVLLSEAAFVKTKNMFKDLEQDNFDKEINNNPCKNNAFAGFQTASKKKVKVSEEALLKSKKVFEDMHLNNEGNNHSSFKVPINKNRKLSAHIDNKIHDNEINNCENMDIEDLINTEVIKDLEDTLNTEDFYKETTPKSKRSGSPILSCPKAKKRKKFEIPKTVKPITPNVDIHNTRMNNVFTFDENYKKKKCINLRNVMEVEKMSTSEVEIDPFISEFRFDTLLKFEFGGKRNDIDNDTWNVAKIKKLFTDSVNKKIIPEGWIDNHLKLIIWKLLSYEIYFPRTMNDICTVKNVLHQLKYRYDRELYNVERPALRKILEKDEVASKRIVLCVVGIYVDGDIARSMDNPAQNVEVLLTDGWYTVMACTDRMINKLICDGKISIGTKLYIHGAELTNCDQGVSPWEDTTSVRLKIFGNSIRRAKWDTRLGFHGNGAILSHLSSVKPEGGKISRLKVFVTRVYPTLYVEKFEDGSTVTRSERLETQYQMKYENERQIQLEKLYEEVEKNCDKESQDSESLDTEKENFETGSQICKMMKKSRDPSEFRAALTESQVYLLQEHASKKREKLIENLQKKIQDLVKKRGLNVNRNVVTLLKVRVADVKNDNISRAMVTIWRPNECLLDLIKEGSWIEMYNVVPTAVRYSEIQISAGRQSIFKISKIKETDKIKSQIQCIKRKSYTIKDLQTPFTTDYNEIDTCGFIFLIEPTNKDYNSTNQLFQNVYLADEYKNIIAINFWGGIKKFGFENILDTGQIVSCVNLQKRHGNTKKSIPQFRATEFTYFTKTCKIDNLRLMTEELCNKYSSLDKRKYIEDCVAIKNNFANIKYGSTDNFSPYRLNNSDYNITRNKVFIDSPTVNKCVDENFNLTGLDFESTFKQTDTQEVSPKTFLRKKKVNDKIAKLEMYGEPPPLKPIHIINKSNIIHNSYKSPLCTSVASVVQKSVNSLASVGKISENDSSPVLNNRTFVRNINPVKLNFSHNNETEDPFAEEFDGSPPLSLG